MLGSVGSTLQWISSPCRVMNKHQSLERKGRLRSAPSTGIPWRELVHFYHSRTTLEKMSFQLSETLVNSARTGQCLGCGAASARADERGIGLGDSHSLRQCARPLPYRSLRSGVVARRSAHQNLRAPPSLPQDP
jgi:hypothetical protein